MNYSDALLESWVNLSMTLRNDRFIENMTFNEIVIIRLLKQQQEKENEHSYLSIKALCDKTKMLKSAINRVLNDLENKEYVERFRFKTNRKNVYIRITSKGLTDYETEHEKIEDIVKVMVAYIGEKEIQNLIINLNKITEISETIWHSKKGGQ